MKHKKIVILSLFLLALGVLGLAAGRARSFRGRQPTPQVANPTSLQGRERDVEPARARNLSMQSEAFKMGRRLGSRFDSAKRETSVMLGTVTIGSGGRNIQIKRVQTDDGEQVEVRIAGSDDTLTWDASQGSLSSGGLASANDRDLIERLVRDSPDQFVLAQLRGASYYTVARNVRPAEATDGYKGPLWDIVRVNDPERDYQKRPQGAWRLYYVNTRSGLIDRIVSEFQGQQVVAEFSWTKVNDEQVPAQIIWTCNGQTLMEYQLGSFSHSRQ